MAANFITLFLRYHSGWEEARLFLFVDNKELQILKLQKNPLKRYWK